MLTLMPVVGPAILTIASASSMQFSDNQVASALVLYDISEGPGMSIVGLAMFDTHTHQVRTRLAFL